MIPDVDVDTRTMVPNGLGQMLAEIGLCWVMEKKWKLLLMFYWGNIGLYWDNGKKWKLLDT